MQSISTKQKKILIEFISTNQRVFFSQSKNRFQKELKWTELSEILNSNGPPTKDIEKWKQVSKKRWKFSLHYYI